jgi:prepilin-type N-terminal cleavage/methylation domain-containing protein
VLRRFWTRRRDQRGFTMIELMIVVNILSILLLAALPSFLGLKDKAMDDANKANLRQALGSINAYYQDNAGFTGMTLPGLLNYNSALDLSKFLLTSVSATTYCVQTPASGTSHVWRMNGPTGLFEKTPC